MSCCQEAQSLEPITAVSGWQSSDLPDLRRTFFPTLNWHPRKEKKRKIAQFSIGLRLTWVLAGHFIFTLLSFVLTLKGASPKMPTTLCSRAVFRHSRLLLRRNNLRQASTTSEAGTKAKETASGTSSKASEGLSRVTSSAGNIVSGAASGARNALSKVGGRTGRLIAFVDCQYSLLLLLATGFGVAANRFAALIPPTVYYARVGLELSKLIFQGQKMSPP